MSNFESNYQDFEPYIPDVASKEPEENLRDFLVGDPVLFNTDPDFYAKGINVPQVEPEPELNANLKFDVLGAIKKSISEQRAEKLRRGVKLTRPRGGSGILNQRSETPILEESPRNPRWSDRERSAHRYRSRKMRVGDLGDMTRALQGDAAHDELSAVMQRSKDLWERTQGEGELHRAYAPLVAGVLGSEAAPEFGRKLDAAAALESDRLKAEARSNDGILYTDVAVVGAGTQAAIYNARLRSERPDLRIVSIDRQLRLGGQFRMYGDRPVFYTNSRGHRPEVQGEIGLPGGGVNLNSFGERAPVQVTDFATNTYATNVEFGLASALNQHMSADTMLGVAVGDRRKDGERYLVDVVDEESGEVYQISARAVVDATGPGQREASPNTVTAEEVLAHFGDEENMFPMDRFVGKTIAIKGGGDTGRILAELFARLAPPEAYGKSTPQLGGARQILWYGADFANRDEYCDLNRSRYTGLSPFLPRENNGLFSPPTDFIVPFKLRVYDVGTDSAGRVFVGLNPDVRGGPVVDMVINAANLTADTFGPYAEFGEATEVTQYIDLAGNGREIRVPIGKELDGGGIQIVGPAARNALTAYEQELTPGIGENTISIWATRFRTEAMAKRKAQQLAI